MCLLYCQISPDPKGVHSYFFLAEKIVSGEGLQILLSNLLTIGKEC